MIENFTNFEKGMRESLSDFELPFDSKQWEELEMRLEGKSASSLNTMSAAVVSALIFISGITYIIVSSSSDDSVQGVTEVVQGDFDSSQNTLEFNDDSDESIMTFEEGFNNAEDEGTLLVEDSNQNSSNTNDKNLNDKDNNLNQRKTDSYKTDLKEEEASKEEIAQIEEDGNKESKVITEILNLAPFITSSAVEICAGEKIEFKAENISDTARFLWNFGNADFSTETNPIRTFNEPGEYNVTLILSKSTEKIESRIIVLPKPDAKFAWNEQTKGQVKLSNLSEKAAASHWQIDNEFTSTDINPTFEYSEAGKKLVTLKVKNEFGCTDSSFRYIQLDEPVEVTAPNAITQAENFLPSLSDPNYGQLMFTIHNMKGQLIYESENGQPWKGTMPDGSYAAPDSEFVWLVLVKNESGKEIYSDSGKVKILP